MAAPESFGAAVAVRSLEVSLALMVFALGLGLLLLSTVIAMGQTQHWAFTAQDLGDSTAKGSVLDEYAGGTATSKVIQASVSGQDATFTTEITSSTLAPWANVGDRFVYTVHEAFEILVAGLVREHGDRRPHRGAPLVGRRVADLDRHEIRSSGA